MIVHNTRRGSASGTSCSWRACLGARRCGFVSASQPHAGDVFNAVPMRRDFRVPTWAMRIIVQRRLGLPLDEALASGEPTCTAPCTARGGRVQDPMDGRFGEQYRARRPQPTPPAARVLRHSRVLITCRACGARWSRWSRRITSATRTTTGGTSLAGGSARRAHAAYRRRQVQGPPLSLPTNQRGGHRAAWCLRRLRQHRARHATQHRLATLHNSTGYLIHKIVTPPAYLISSPAR